MKKRSSRFLAGVLAFAMALTLIPSGIAAQAAQNPPSAKLEVLEIQPGTAYTLTEAMFNSVRGTKSVNITRMSMPEFISKVDDVNGKYDIVYVGNNTSGGSYSVKGAEAGVGTGKSKTITLQSSDPLYGRSYNEYYPGNDITVLKSGKLKEYIEAGQLMIFDDTIFTDGALSGTNLRQQFAEYRNNVGYPNVRMATFGTRTDTITENQLPGGEKFTAVYYNWRDHWLYGLDYFYYNRYSDTTSSISSNWGTGSPNSSVLGNDKFSIRWDGRLKAAVTGTYTFSVTADDGVRVFVSPDSTVNDSDRIINQWKDQAATTYTATKNLTKDQIYYVRVEYYENGGDAMIDFSWQYSVTTSVNTLQTAIDSYSGLAKRPVLSIVSGPKEYNGTQASYESGRTLGFSFDAHTDSPSNQMRANLYVDLNGDGIFVDEYDINRDGTITPDENIELVVQSNALSSSGLSTDDDEYGISYVVPDSFNGVMPWKLELVDLQTGAKSYETGFTAFDGANPTVVRVLQLTPSSGTNLLYIKNLSSSLLKKNGEYEIKVSDMKISDFDNNYPNPVGGVPTLLNGNYDMVIIGFQDSYQGSLTKAAAINGLRDFINTKQSVMFTHDTIYATSSSFTNLTADFRTVVGQNIYANTSVTPYPEANKVSYGLTRLHLDLIKTGTDSYGNPNLPNTTTTYQLNKTLLTMYPYVLPATMTVARTHHQYFQLDLEDPEVIPVFTMENGKRLNHSNGNVVKSGGSEVMETRINKYDGRNDYYTYTKGSITYSGTGHTAPSGIEEQRMFVNTILKATRGANHAPELAVYGISNGMNIMPDTTVLRFSFKATDLDKLDTYLNADIYLDKDNNGSFDSAEKMISYTADSMQVRSGSEIQVELPKTLNKVSGLEPTQFRVKVVTYDSSNARAEQVITLSHKDEPTLTLAVSADKPGYLTGDTALITFGLNAAKSKTDLTATYSGIKLATPVANSNFSILSSPRTLSGDQLMMNYSDVVFSPSPNRTSQENTVALGLLKANNYTLNAALNYNKKIGSGSAFAAPEISTAYSLDVRSGIISGTVTNSKGRIVKNISVKLEKKNGSAWTTAGTSLTNAYGKYSFEELSTGDYRVSVTAPSGYTGVDNGGVVTTSLQFSSTARTSYEKDISFRLLGDPVKDVAITASNGAGKIAVKSGESKAMAGKVSFTLVRSVTELGIELDTDNLSNLTFTGTPKLYQQDGKYLADGTLSSTGQITIPPSKAALLSVGSSYYVTFQANTGTSVSDFGAGSGASRLRASQFYYRDVGTDVSDTCGGAAAPLLFAVVGQPISSAELTGLNGKSSITAGSSGNIDFKISFVLNQAASVDSIANEIKNNLPSGSTLTVKLNKLKKPDGSTVDSTTGLLAAGAYEIYGSAKAQGSSISNLQSFSLTLEGIGSTVSGDWDSSVSFYYASGSSSRVLLTSPRLQ